MSSNHRFPRVPNVPTVLHKFLRKRNQRNVPHYKPIQMSWLLLHRSQRKLKSYKYIPIMSIICPPFVQKQALQNLCAQEGIIIKPSDKGGNIVIMDRVQYVAICNRILGNEEWYKKSLRNTLVRFRMNSFYFCWTLLIKESLLKIYMRPFSVNTSYHAHFLFSS